MTRHLAAALLLIAVLAGCGGSSEPGPTPSVATSASPSAEQEATAAYQRYWDTYVQIANSGDVNAAAFDGVADGPFIELALKNLGDQATSGVVRVGEPTFGEFQTTVDGDSATSTVCVDESQWGAKVDGEPIPDSTSDTPEPRAVTGTLAERDSGWIVTDSAFDEGVPCP